MAYTWVISLLSSRRLSSASERWCGSQRVNIVVCAVVFRLPLHCSTSSVPMESQPQRQMMMMRQSCEPSVASIKDKFKFLCFFAISINFAFETCLHHSKS
ncbi:hypothetical protein AHAS_Ahas05G0214000 [Arachis hypogaea]